MLRKHLQVTAIMALAGLFAVVGPAAADQFQPVPTTQAPVPEGARAAPIVSVFQFATAGLATPRQTDQVGRVPKLTLKLRVRSVRESSRGGSIRSKAVFDLLGKGRPFGNRQRLALTLPSGSDQGVQLVAGGWPKLRRGLTVRADFVYWLGKWVAVSAKPTRHRAHKRSPGTKRLWAKFGCCTWPTARLPVRFRIQGGIPAWAYNGIIGGWSWWTTAGSSFSAVYAGPGGSGNISQCGSGSWVVFANLPPSVAGLGAYCSDSRGIYEQHALLSANVNYPLAQVAAHEVGHGIGLDHSPDPNAVMYFRVNGATGLAADDLAGLRALYPRRSGSPAGLALGSNGDGRLPIGLNADGRQQAFIVGQDGQLWTNYQAQLNGVWSGWTPLGGQWLAASRIGVGRNADGRQQVYLVGQDGQLWTNYQAQINGGWSGWKSLGGRWPSNAAIAVGVNADGRQQVYLVGQDGQLWTNYQVEQNGAWSSWKPLGGFWPSGAQIGVGVNADGRQQVYLVGQDGQLWTNYQTTQGGGWSTWKPLGGQWPPVDAIAVGRNADGRQQIYLVGQDGQLWTNYQVELNGAWSTWKPLGGSWWPQVSIGVGRNADGRQQVYLVGQDGQLWTNYQTQINGGWSSWKSLGGSWAGRHAIGVGRNADGRQQVYLVGQDGQFWTNYQAQLNGGWASWVALGGSWPVR